MPRGVWRLLYRALNQLSNSWYAPGQTGGHPLCTAR